MRSGAPPSLMATLAEAPPEDRSEGRLWLLSLVLSVRGSGGGVTLVGVTGSVALPLGGGVGGDSQAAAACFVSSNAN